MSDGDRQYPVRVRPLRVAMWATSNHNYAAIYNAAHRNPV
jgi:hypothetical protein